MESDELATAVLTVTTEEWRRVIDDLDQRCIGIVRATLEQGTKVSWLKQGEVSLFLADDEEIRGLNGPLPRS